MRDHPVHPDLAGRVVRLDEARALGLTGTHLRRVAYRRVAPRVWADRAVPLDLLGRAAAHAASLEPPGVLAGTTAALAHGVDVGLRDEAVQLVVRGPRPRARPGLVVARDALPDEDVGQLDGVLVTTPLRTAVDLSRGLPLGRYVPTGRATLEAVVALDGVCRTTGVTPGAVRGRLEGLPRGSRGRAAGLLAVSLADPRAESPQETRTRVALVAAGLPPPQVQLEVRGRDGRRRRLDLAYEEVMVGVEYDGEVHETRLQADLERYASLCPPWLLVRVGRGDVPARPDALVRRTWEALSSRGWDLPRPVAVRWPAP